MNFSVLMTTYIGETSENLDESLNSILCNQSVLPSQVVLVLDGPIKPECKTVIEKYKANFPVILDIIDCPVNQGQSKASAIGLEYIKYDLLARMDSDDISVFNRFEKELNAFEQHPDCDVVGGWIEEFAVVPGDLGRIRVTPEADSDVKRMFRNRTPVNNVTAMIRTEALKKAGGYGRKTVNEDYSLYVHMWVNGSNFYNIQENMVNVRIGNGMTTRRKDFRIFTDWYKDQKYLVENNKESFFTALISCAKCFGFVVMPNNLKRLIYKYFLRSKK